MEFELRRLQASDLFSMVQIINKIGIDNIRNAINFDEIKNVKNNLTDENKDETFNKLGVDIVMSVLSLVMEKLPLIEKDLYRFMGSVANMKDKDVAKLGLSDFMALFIAIFTKEEFKDFFSQALSLIK